MRQVMRLHHDSLHTERAYVDWIKRYVHFHRMQRREDLGGGEAKIEAFLTDLAVNGQVAPATKNQALNALVHRRLIWSGSMHAPSLPPSGR
ncbi:MAG: site-specific integrase [Verrucomicrobiota bacterium]